MSPSARALVLELRAQGRSVRVIVAAAGALGYRVSRSGVARVVGPKPKPRPRRRPRRLVAGRLASTALRLAGDPAAALVALDAARAQLAAASVPVA